MTYLNLFSDKNLSDDRKDIVLGDERDIVVDDGQQGQVIDFHSISEHPHAFAHSLVHRRYHYHFVPSFDQVRGQLEGVRLDTAPLGSHEICCEADAVSLFGIIVQLVDKVQNFSALRDRRVVEALNPVVLPVLRTCVCQLVVLKTHGVGTSGLRLQVYAEVIVFLMKE